MLVVWDEPKRVANLVKHGLDFAEFDEAFDFEGLLALPGKPDTDGRARFVFIGGWNGAVVVTAVIAMLRSEALSLISLRRASTKERKAYENS